MKLYSSTWDRGKLYVMEGSCNLISWQPLPWRKHHQCHWIGLVVPSASIDSVINRNNPHPAQELNTSSSAWSKHWRHWNSPLPFCKFLRNPPFSNFPICTKLTWSSVTVIRNPMTVIPGGIKFTYDPRVWNLWKDINSNSVWIWNLQKIYRRAGIA